MDEAPCSQKGLVSGMGCLRGLLSQHSCSPLIHMEIRHISQEAINRPKPLKNDLHAFLFLEDQLQKRFLHFQPSPGLFCCLGFGSMSKILSIIGNATNLTQSIHQDTENKIPLTQKGRNCIRDFNIESNTKSWLNRQQTIEKAKMEH